MKKYIIALSLFLFLMVNLKAQYVGFEPNNGHVYLCSGTNSQVTVYIYWNCEITTYPERSVASYVKFYAEGQTYESNYSNTNVGNHIPASMLLGSGIHEWTIELYELFLGAPSFTVTATATHTFYVKYTLGAANMFGGGTINLEGDSVASGSTVQKMVNESMSVGAIDQNDGAGYNRIWNTSGTNNSNWWKNYSPINGATPRNYSYTIQSGDNGSTIVADLKKICTLTFVNSSANIYAGGSTNSSPTSRNVTELNPIYAYGLSYTSNGLDGVFSHWTIDGETVGTTITPDAHGTYTAVYTHKPTNSGEYPYCSSSVGQAVTITWNENPNTAVTQYQIWRRVKHNGVTGSPQLLATVSRGVCSYTDVAYLKTSSYVDLLWYDVRAYYSTEGTYSDPDYFAVYGEENYKLNNANTAQVELAKELPTEYAVNNYPNPFNPTTKISYQLPENGLVTIKVYDILGKEVAELVNGVKQAGYYEVNFDAGKLTSGIYVYTIQSGKFTESKKMMLMK